MSQGSNRSARSPHNPFGSGGQSPPYGNVPLLDVNRATEELRGELLAAVERVIDSGRFLHGPDVTELEQSVAKLCGVKHAVACASGSDAVLLALMALDVGDGD